MNLNRHIELLKTACKTAIDNDPIESLMTEIIETNEEDVAKTIEMAKKALAINSTFNDPKVILAVLDRSRQDLAEEYLSQVVSVQPNNSLAMWYMAYSKLLSGKPMEAVDLLKTATKCNPCDTFVNLTLAWLLKTIGSMSECKSLVNNLVRAKYICSSLAMLFSSESSQLLERDLHFLYKQCSCLTDLIRWACDSKVYSRRCDLSARNPQKCLLNEHSHTAVCNHLINPSLEIFKYIYGPQVMREYINSFFSMILIPEIKIAICKSNLADFKPIDQIPPEMVLVLSGKYTVGANIPNLKYPEKEYNMPSYLIDRYPVTNRDWQKFQPSHRFPKGHENYPVVNVDFIQASLFARSQLKRLPTELEWESAARGQTSLKYRFPWGMNPDPGRANCAENKLNHLTSVTRYPRGASPVGAQDMLGNAMEWCDSSISQGPNHRLNRIVKGGGWSRRSADMAAWLRTQYPVFAKGPNIGFRCVKDLNIDYEKGI